VVLVERNEQIGGFIATEQRTRPGYRHDTYSSWHPQFVSGPAFAVLRTELEECGLEYANADDELAARVTTDGEVTMAYRSVRKTAGTFVHREDARAYRMAIKRILDNGAGLGILTSAELRSLAAVQAMAGLARSNGIAGSQRWLRDLATSGRSWCRREFVGCEVDRL
jgi:phytoene dehydrogenase-like protein